MAISEGEGRIIQRNMEKLMQFFKEEVCKMI